MTIKLPKHLRGFAYDQVMPVDLNSFDVDLLLPSVFFKVITEGQTWGRRINDPTKIDEYVAALAGHEDLDGFDGQAGHRLLERLVRTSLVQIGWKGTARRIQQIEGINSFSLLAFKPEFPSEHSRLRRVDALIHRMMRDQFREDDDALRAFFVDIFGKGVEIRRGPEPDGWYDGTTELDTMTRLSIALIDGFESAGVRKPKDRQPREVCPAVACRMARDLWRYLEAYRGLLPTEALVFHLKAIINFDLFVYSLKLFYAIPQLVDDATELPAAMRKQLEPSPPDLYVDFIGWASGLSRDMAAHCVRRDLEAIARFAWANLMLRQLDRYVHWLKGDRRVANVVTAALGDDDGGPDYLRSLLALRKDATISVRIDFAAHQNEEEITRENRIPDQGDDLLLESEEIDRIAGSAESDFDRLVLLLVEAQRSKVTQNLVAWYWSVGGLTKPHGVLTGALRSRQSWRYAPSNDLLATLVQLAMVDIPKWDKDDPGPQPIELQEFLDWLYERFGMLVDRPPEGFDGPDYVAAAQENLRAMLRRLRQMGVFRDLSDDFTVQRLTPPFAAASDTANTANV